MLVNTASIAHPQATYNSFDEYSLVTTGRTCSVPSASQHVLRVGSTSCVAELDASLNGTGGVVMVTVLVGAESMDVPIRVFTPIVTFDGPATRTLNIVGGWHVVEGQSCVAKFQDTPLRVMATFHGPPLGGISTFPLLDVTDYAFASLVLSSGCMFSLSLGPLLLKNSCHSNPSKWDVLV